MPITALLLHAVPRNPVGDSAVYKNFFGTKYLLQYVSNKIEDHLKAHLPMIQNRIDWLSSKIDVRKQIQKYELEFSSLGIPIESKKEALSYLDAFLNCAIEEVIELALYGNE